MDTSSLANQLLQETTAFHTYLIEQARAVAKLRDIFDFLVECQTFADTYLPQGTLNAWKDGQDALQVLSERTQIIYTSPVNSLSVLLRPTFDTGGTVATGTFGFLTDNFGYLEDATARSQYSLLAGKYGALLSGPEAQQQIYIFLGSVDPIAQNKFDQSMKSIQSLPQNEDPQGPLLEMRSAIDLTLDALLKIAGLSKRERGDLKKIDILPKIASMLARNELAKVDLVLANEQLEKLKSQLAASKQTAIPRVQAEALMNQAIAILNLVASTVDVPDQQRAS